MALKPKRTWLVMSPVAALAIFVGSGGSGTSARTRTIGLDRVVATESLPDVTDDVCAMPGMESASLTSAIASMERLPRSHGLACVMPPAAAAAGAPGAAQEVSAGAGTVYEARTRSGQINRKPARYIKDPWPAWSSIAVNAENDMVVMTDENLFRIVEYSRRDNTPAAAAATEPRRVIGGDNTRTEMLCGAYIDPKTLEVYVTNNDTQNWMPVFSREARGNAAPDRMLMTPHRTWGITSDEPRDEVLMTVQNPSAVMVYRKQASNNEAPLRILEGDATELADPHGITLDMKRELMVISNHGHKRFYGGPAVSTLKETWEEWIKPTDDLNSLPRRFVPGLGQFDLPSIAIYARGASGNAAPLRVIKGPKTQLNWPGHVAVHEERGEIFVANDADDSVLVFRITDSGDVAPIRVIKGPKTRVKFPTGLAMDQKNNELWVASMGNYTAAVFPVTANGDVPPLRAIRGGPSNRVGLMIGNPGAIGYDKKRQEILVPN